MSVAIGDRRRLDREIASLVAELREASARLDRGLLEDPEIPPQRSWLYDHDLRGWLAEDDDPWSRALDQWWRAIGSERRAWPERVRARDAFLRPHTVDGLGDVSLRALRLQVLTASSPVRARALLDAFTGRSPAVASPSVDGWVQRYEREGAALDQVDEADEPVPDLAREWLVRTHELAEAISPREHPADVLRAGLGRDAGEGWPARLRPRWLEDVFGPAGWLVGRQVPPPSVPRRIGATSFARALGRFGAALLDAARPPHVPFTLHQAPWSLRRHRRHYLFAALPLSEAFQRRVLGLGDHRVGDQRRRLARAALASLRIDAFRVALRNVVPDGAGALREAHADLGRRIFGRPPAPSWATVLPAWRSRDAVAFAGALAAVHDERALVERFDEDWFLNPAAAAALLAQDAGPVGAAAPLPEGWSRDALATLVTRLEALAT